LRYLETILVVFFRGRLGRIPFLFYRLHGAASVRADKIEIQIGLSGIAERPTEMCKVYGWEKGGYRN
jgi:hypothetical protein